MLNVPTNNFFPGTTGVGKKSNTIEIVFLKNGYVETMGIRQYFYHMVSKRTRD